MSNPNCDKLGHLKNGTRIMCAQCYNKQANAVKRVRELHKPWNDLGEQWCEHCKSGKQDTEPVKYPCPTIKALDGDK